MKEEESKKKNSYVNLKNCKFLKIYLNWRAKNKNARKNTIET